MANKYNWVDDPCISGKSPCDTDVLNENLMHIKYDVTDEIQKKADDAINEVVNAVAVQRIYDCGISTDTKGFEIVKELAHSTFDKSKFEVVGSPTITDDGVASGFSADNIVKIPDKYFSSNLSALDISLLINTQDLSIANQGIFGCKQKENTSMAVLDVRMTNSGGQLVYSTGLGTQKDTTFTAQWLGQGKDKINFKINNSKIELFINEELILTVNDFVYVQPIDFYIGSNRNKADIFQGSIDLKSIAIWADGVPAFNGNKTGLYVAKPDNYEVVGSPTITDDGIASGFSDTNYVQKRLDLSSMKTSIKINASFIFDNSRTEGTIWNKDLNFDFRVAASGNVVLRTFNGSGSQAFTLSNAQTGLKTGDNVDSSVIVTENQAIIIINGKTYTKSMTTDLSNIATSSVIMRFGKANIQELYYPNLIDLNSFKIYIDGNIVYQPCLKIPYTETFEHPNVVDVAYRNRVQDLYEQTGEALFYTIDEQNQNFTLPMGDIYGMITKNREILDIVYPIGRPIPEENNVLLDNEVWLEGATVNPIDYPKLFKVYGTKYGGDGITTFGLPDLRGRTIWGSPDGSSGYIEAKLPNIKGAFVADCGGQGASANGAFAVDAGYTMHGRGTDNSPHATYSINASRSNSIYSDDATTVQPPAFKVRWKTRFE